MIYDNLIPSNVRQDFINKVIEISKYLSIKPEWLMQVMKSESGINPKARNTQNGKVVAVGLIQFMQPTAKGLGTTLDDLYNMSYLQQLDYVKKYYTPFRNKMKSYYDVYLVTFFPAAVGKPDSWTFQSSNLSASLIAKQNPVININKDNKITISEFKQYLTNTVPSQFRALIFGSPIVGVLILVLFIALFYYYN